MLHSVGDVVTECRTGSRLLDPTFCSGTLSSAVAALATVSGSKGPISWASPPAAAAADAGATTFPAPPPSSLTNTTCASAADPVAGVGRRRSNSAEAADVRCAASTWSCTRRRNAMPSTFAPAADEQTHRRFAESHRGLPLPYRGAEDADDQQQQSALQPRDIRQPEQFQGTRIPVSHWLRLSDAAVEVILVDSRAQDKLATQTPKSSKDRAACAGILHYGSTVSSRMWHQHPLRPAKTSISRLGACPREQSMNEPLRNYCLQRITSETLLRLHNALFLAS